MALQTKTISDDASNGNHKFTLSITENSTSTSGNTSSISWKFQLSSLGGNYDWEYSGTVPVTYTVKINGTTYTGNIMTYDGSSTVTVKSGSSTIAHNDDGKKSISYSFSVSSISAYYLPGSASASGSMSLTNIPRYGTSNQSLNSKTETSIKMNWSSDSTVDYIWYSKDNGSSWTGINVTDGKSGSYTISSLSANTTYKIKTRIRRKDSQLTTDSSTLSVTTYNYPYCTDSPNFKIGDEVTLKFYNPLGREFTFYIIANGIEIENNWTKSGTSYTGISATSSQNQLYATIPNSTSGKYQVKVVYGSITKTRNNGNTYSIKGTETPTYSTFTYKDSNTTVTNITGNNQILVKGHSNLQVNIASVNKMVANKNANPKNYVISIDSLTKTVNYSTNDITADVGKVNASGSKRLSVRAYDSRNLSTLAYKDITIYDYAKPVINVSVSRLNSFEAQSTLEVNGNYTRLTINNSDKNTINTVQYRYREVKGTWSSWIELNTTVDKGKFTCSDVILSLDNTKAFEFQVQAIDNLDSNTGTGKLDVGEAIFFISTNKKECYINNNKVLVDTINITEVATDLNNYITTGTYYFTSSFTPVNIPGGVNGWLEVIAEPQYGRVKQIWYRAGTNNSNDWHIWVRSRDTEGAWSNWRKLALIDDVYPVGSIYMSGTNTNPSSKLGGTWKLIDKEFESFSSHIEDSTYCTPNTNFTVGGTYVIRAGHNLRVRQYISNNVELTDTTVTMGTFDFKELGISSLFNSIQNQLAFSDAENSGIVYTINYTTGAITQIDKFNADKVPSGIGFYLYFDVTLPMSCMLDSVCDKFYWKRTA